MTLAQRIDAAAKRMRDAAGDNLTSDELDGVLRDVAATLDDIASAAKDSLTQVLAQLDEDEKRCTALRSRLPADYVDGVVGSLRYAREVVQTVYLGHSIERSAAAIASFNRVTGPR